MVLIGALFRLLFDEMPSIVVITPSDHYTRATMKFDSLILLLAVAVSTASAGLPVCGPSPTFCATLYRKVWYQQCYAQICTNRSYVFCFSNMSPPVYEIMTNKSDIFSWFRAQSNDLHTCSSHCYINHCDSTNRQVNKDCHTAACYQKSHYYANYYETSVC